MGIHTCIHADVYTHTHMHTHGYTQKYTCIHICIHTDAHTHIDAHTLILARIRVYICMHIRIKYTHAQAHKSLLDEAVIRSTSI